jgi:hypothetical protein
MSSGDKLAEALRRPLRDQRANVRRAGICSAAGWIQKVHSGSARFSSVAFALAAKAMTIKAAAVRM